MHLKCPLGHFLYPNFEQGRQDNPFTSSICELFPANYGPMPNSGTVFPHTEIISFL
jgi:hypothetical protein